MMNKNNKEDEIIRFVGKIRKSGTKKIINVPRDKFKYLKESNEYYKVFLIPVDFDLSKKDKK